MEGERGERRDRREERDRRGAGEKRRDMREGTGKREGRQAKGEGCERGERRKETGEKRGRREAGEEREESAIWRGHWQCPARAGKPAPRFVTPTAESRLRPFVSCAGIGYGRGLLGGPGGLSRVQGAICGSVVDRGPWWQKSLFIYTYECVCVCVHVIYMYIYI